MSFIQRELDRIQPLLSDSNREKYNELYAVQQVLCCALEPDGFASPYKLLMGTQGGSEDCSADLRQPLSLDTRFPVLIEQ